MHTNVGCEAMVDVQNRLGDRGVIYVQQLTQGIRSERSSLHEGSNPRIHTENIIRL